tara:strand:+ start:13307 stop:13561 length:255 start_codon:yes stop_codon:yes gene_type:complete
MALGISVSIIGFFCIKFAEYQKKENYRIQKLDNKVQSILDSRINHGMQVIDTIVPIEHTRQELSRTKLVWAPEIGAYVIRRQIN